MSFAWIIVAFISGFVLGFLCLLVPLILIGALEEETKPKLPPTYWDV